MGHSLLDSHFNLFGILFSMHNLTEDMNLFFDRIEEMWGKKHMKKDIDKLLSKVNLEQFSENVFFLGKTAECETSESETFNEIMKCIDQLKEYQSQWNVELPAEFH